MGQAIERLLSEKVDSSKVIIYATAHERQSEEYQSLKQLDRQLRVELDFLREIYNTLNLSTC